jgi:hypothetical protein
MGCGDLIGMIIGPIVLAGIVWFSLWLPQALGLAGIWHVLGSVFLVAFSILALTYVLNPEMRRRRPATTSNDEAGNGGAV